MFFTPKRLQFARLELVNRPICQVESLAAMASAKATPALNLPSDVSVLKTKEAAKRGLDASVGQTEVVWPKPEFVSGPASRAHSTHTRPHCDTSRSKHPTLIQLIRNIVLLQGPSTTIEFVTKEGKEMSGFILPAGSMFSLG